MEFRKTHLQKLFETVERFGLDPASFQLDQSGKTVILKLKDSGLRFTIERSDVSYNTYKWRYTVFTPDRREINYPKKTELGIDDVVVDLSSWLNNVVKDYLTESNTQNPWERLKHFQQSITSPRDNEPLSASERTILKDMIDDFPSLLAKELNKLSDQFGESDLRISDSLEHLKKRIDENANRIEIRQLLIGIVIDRLIEYGLNSSIFSRFIDFFIQYFQNLNDPPPTIWIASSNL